MIKEFFKKLFASAPTEETVAVKSKTEKELATERGEPWVAVLDTKVNIQNPRNGFFELDWNEPFIAMLKANGFQGENDEEIVDHWFRELCRNILADEGMSERMAGSINVVNIQDAKK
jgi:hypothetical protein